MAPKKRGAAAGTVTEQATTKPFPSINVEDEILFNDGMAFKDIRLRVRKVSAPKTTTNGPDDVLLEVSLAPGYKKGVDYPHHIYLKAKNRRSWFHARPSGPVGSEPRGRRGSAR